MSKACDPMDWSPSDSSVPGKNTGVSYHFLLQGIFLTQRSNPCLLLYRWILNHWATQRTQNISCISNPSIPTSKSHSYFSCCLVTKSCLTLGTPWTMSCKTPLVYGISQAEILEWVPFTSEKLPNPGIKPMSCASPELADGSFPPEPPIVND